MGNKFKYHSIILLDWTLAFLPIVFFWAESRLDVDCKSKDRFTSLLVPVEIYINVKTIAIMNIVIKLFVFWMTALRTDFYSMIKVFACFFNCFVSNIFEDISLKHIYRVV